MYERHCGVQSPWYAYINTLPQTYSTPVYWSHEALSSLPSDICQDARLLVNKMAKNFSRLQDLFQHIEAILGESVVGAFTLNYFNWAWTSVYTRCVYMRPPNFTVGSSEDDCIALAPLLDLLNHSPNVQVNSLYLWFTVGGFSANQLLCVTAYIWKKFETGIVCVEWSNSKLNFAIEEAVTLDLLKNSPNIELTVDWF